MNNNKVEHLKMIQNVIKRMASNSAEIKKVYLIFLGIAASFLTSEYINTNYSFIYVFFIIVISSIFGFLDMYYLYLERGFIKKYNKLISDLNSKTDFLINPIFKNKFKEYWCTSLSISIFLFYPLQLLICFSVFIIKYLFFKRRKYTSGKKI